jgi:REP element-mobilizing transposase RayT
MENTKVRKVMYGLESLIEASYMTPLKKQQMARSIPKYRQAMEMVRQKEDFTDSDIKAFQKAVDEWFQDYVAVHGLDGMTNYIHMLSTGHVAEYMIKWRNLYRHSQQGWEAFNSLLKTFFFRRTGRGGGRHLRSKLLPIARWLQRRMIWLTGITEEELREACRLLDEDVNVEEEKEQDEEEQKEQDPNEDGDPEQEDLAQLLLSLQQTSGFI